MKTVTSRCTKGKKNWFSRIFYASTYSLAQNLHTTVILHVESSKFKWSNKMQQLICFLIQYNTRKSVKGHQDHKHICVRAHFHCFRKIPQKEPQQSSELPCLIIAAATQLAQCLIIAAANQLAQCIIIAAAT